MKILSKIFCDQRKAWRFSWLSILLFSIFIMGHLAQAQQSNVIPGRVMVKFNYDEIELPPGLTEVDFEQVNIRSAVVRLALRRFQINRIARVVPIAVKGDTIRILPDGTRIKLTDLFDLYLLKFPENIPADSVIAALELLKPVIYAAPDQFLIPTAQPNDQLYSQQWHLKQASGEDIDAEPAWDLSKGDNVKIAIVDEGVRTTHDDLDGKIQGGETTMFSNHGTRVAGVAAAETNNFEGVAGVGWNSRIIPYNTGGTLSGGIADINAAVAAGAHVINMSWAAASYDQSLKDALDNAAAQGIILVTAAGNNLSAEGNPVPFIDYPQAFDGLVTSVSATNSQGQFNEGWNYGYFVDMAAPGVGIFTTDGDNDTDYGSFNGTSYSAPIVSGIVALLRAYDPSLIDRDFERIIELSAEPKGDPGWDQKYGHGRVNAHEALQLVNSNEIYHWTATGGTVTSSVYAGWWMYDLPGAPNGYYVGHRREVRKTVTFPQSFSSLPQVWGRINGTVGYHFSHANTCYSIPWCDVVPGTVTYTGATLRTFVYEICRANGTYCGWYPTTPANVSFAYTVLGIPGTPPPTVTIDGLTSIQPGVEGIWTATVSGGSGTISYQWSVRYEGSSNFQPLGIDQEQRLTFLDECTINELKVVVNRGGQIAEDFHTVYVTGQGGVFCKRSAGESETDELAQVPVKFALHQNFPNPFNPETAIRFGLPQDEHVQLMVIDLLGREVRKLVDNDFSAGYHSVVWDGKDNAGNVLPSGVYIYQIAAGTFRDWKKLALVR